ncbi:TetR/AcrR family transcriptional regulator [Lacticaseibacillus brantae]|uniref:HTH tetR-type domain-containing protein n=1 Tax=Lacticaseibacillus brantae DSM 23927 TaxID=1423727 RepID=A0A0R2BAQ1_9LACO|nr:TetR/AcrR family transcriptional regulator [Lacticaseibacillus brantae]KRM72828.1 hypothetical protein FC34_GL000539 [Lacticaseibacillus brantae DSM 23927]
MATETDRRTLKTRGQLYQALLALLNQTHDFDQLTVALIAQTAGVTRSTFYLHYPDKATFLDAAIETASKGLFEACVTYTYSDQYADYPVFNLQRAFFYLSQHRLDLLALINVDREGFLAGFKQLLMGYINEFTRINAIPDIINHLPLEMLTRFLSTNFIDFAWRWAILEDPESPMALAQLFKEISMLHIPGAESLNGFFIGE